MDNITKSSQNDSKKYHTDIDSKESLLPSYKCKKCRFKLFNFDQIVIHKQESEFQGFQFKQKCEFYAKSNSIPPSNQITCSREIYIQPLKWFENRLDEISGKINCPKCDSKLGSFDWSGSKCACGAWITPSFHISKSKIDFNDSILVE